MPPCVYLRVYHASLCVPQGVHLPPCVCMRDMRRIESSLCVGDHEAHRALPAPVWLRINVSYVLPAPVWLRINVSYGPAAGHGPGEEEGGLMLVLSSSGEKEGGLMLLMCSPLGPEPG